ncbi:MAG: BrnT family toxin [Thermomicrobiales bacterium]
MQRPEANGIRWEEWNITKLAAHGIAEREVEQVLYRNPIWAPDPRHENRYKMIGYTYGGRGLTIIVAITEELELLPITGWDADDEERTRYLSQWRDDR